MLITVAVLVAIVAVEPEVLLVVGVRGMLRRLEGADPHLLAGVVIGDLCHLGPHPL
jgi:hypothetical protein